MYAVLRSLGYKGTFKENNAVGHMDDGLNCKSEGRMARMKVIDIHHTLLDDGQYWDKVAFTSAIINIASKLQR